jgi:hypothetical protein
MATITSISRLTPAKKVHTPAIAHSYQNTLTNLHRLRYRPGPP